MSDMTADAAPRVDVECNHRLCADCVVRGHDIGCPECACPNHLEDDGSRPEIAVLAELAARRAVAMIPLLEDAGYAVLRGDELDTLRAAAGRADEQARYKLEAMNKLSECQDEVAKLRTQLEAADLLLAAPDAAEGD